MLFISPGGKTTLIPQLKEIWPEPHVDYNRYIEPFAGGLACFFAFPKVKENIFNDKDNLIANFYRVAIERPDELTKKIKATLLAEGEIKRAHELILNPNNNSDLDKAWAFWVVNEMSHMNSRQTFLSITDKKDSGFSSVIAYYNKINSFVKNAKKLEGTIVYDRNGIDIVKKGNKDTLIFIDPPYVNSRQRAYKKNKFFQEDLDKLLNLILKYPSKIILTLYKDNVDLDLFLKNGWNYRVVQKICTFGTRKFEDRKEEIILYNYTPRNSQRKLFDIKDQ